MSAAIPTWLSMLLCAVSGLLLALAYPPVNLWLLAWIALVPLMLVILKQSSLNSKVLLTNSGQDSKNSKFHFSSFILHPSSFHLGFLAGLIFWLCDLYWLLWLGATAEGIPRSLAWVLAILAWLALSAMLAVFWGAWAAMVSALGKRFDVKTSRGGLVIATLGSCAWVTLEWLRAHLWVGFPWNQLGVSQWKNLLLVQIVEQTGIYGVSFVLSFFSLAIACSLSTPTSWSGSTSKSNLWRPKPVLYAALGLVAAALTNGIFSIMAQGDTHAGATHALSVAVIQGNIAQNDKWRAANEEMILGRYVDLTRKAAATKPQLIVWPETSTPQPLSFHQPTYDAVTGLAREGEMFLLVGTHDAQLDERGRTTGVGGSSRVLLATSGNAAFLVRPDGSFDQPPYWKIRLVPFGEYMPLSHVFPALGRLVPFPEIEPGRDYRVFSVNSEQHAMNVPPPTTGAKFSVLICFEDVFPNMARHFVRDGAEFLVNLTNDAWWGRSGGAEQHAANAVFRAVENRVWLVRSANTGISCFISPLGRIERAVPSFEEGFGVSAIHLRPPSRDLTFYTKYGDVFALACMAAIVIWLTIEGLTYARRPSTQT